NRHWSKYFFSFATSNRIPSEFRFKGLSSEFFRRFNFTLGGKNMAEASATTQTTPTAGWPRALNPVKPAGLENLGSSSCFLIVLLHVIFNSPLLLLWLLSCDGAPFKQICFAFLVEYVFSCDKSCFPS